VNEPILRRMVIEGMVKCTRKTELQVFWELVQEVTFRKFMYNNLGEANPDYTQGCYVRDRFVQCKFYNLTSVPELMSRLSFFMDNRFYNEDSIAVEIMSLEKATLQDLGTIWLIRRRVHFQSDESNSEDDNSEIDVTMDDFLSP
jgi:hypothetical protein